MVLHSGQDERFVVEFVELLDNVLDERRQVSDPSTADANDGFAPVREILEDEHVDGLITLNSGNAVSPQASSIVSSGTLRLVIGFIT